MAKRHALLVAVLTASILHAAASSSTDETGTAYDVLDRNNLPRGLLPQGVQSFVLHVDGALEVTLPGECSFVVTADGRQYRFRYGRSVGGQLFNSSITRVHGVALQLAGTWLDVTEMDNVGGNFIKMQLKTSTQYFPVPAFVQSPRCN